MKKVFGITTVFIGLVIGAGFASGREIFEYFCIPTQTNLSGIIIASVSFGAICYIIMHLSKKCNTANFDELISHISGRFAHVTQIYMITFMFCGFFIMLSACGTLATESFGLPSRYGIWFLAAVCFAVFSFNTKGLIALNAILVPVMITGIVYLCTVSTLATIPVFNTFHEIKTLPITAALCYTSYNTITAGAVLVPLSATATKKQVLYASIISGTILGLLIFITWLCMNRYHIGLSDSEMPLLELATRESERFRNLYTFVLFAALCTTAVSHGFGILSGFTFRQKRHRIAAAAFLCISAIPFTRFGFSTLVAKLYSTFGYIGFLWTGALLFKYLKSHP